jgi:arsenite methyltransferase
MARMAWFWRLVCEPGCSEACQTDCPGCRALAAEWESNGHALPETGPWPARFRWSRLPVLVRCFSRSKSAKLIAGLVPGRSHASATSAAPGASCCVSVSGDDAVLKHVPGDETALKEQVVEHCSAMASAVLAGSSAGCCSTPAKPAEEPPSAADLADNLVYSGVAKSGLAVATHSTGDLADAPAEAVLASLGCGNPIACADLQPGEVVLDLGSGGGMDAVAAARRVGPDGRVIGLDMSDDMRELARANAARAGVANAEFVKGDLEDVPLPDASVDVVISNCVLPVLRDKRRALSEAYRVLRPGGRLALSDIVTRKPVPAALKLNLKAWLWCLGGALTEDEYREHLIEAGFSEVVISRNRVYTMTDAEAAGLLPVIREAGVEAVLDAGFASSSVLAAKPGEASSPSPNAGVRVSEKA